MSSSVQESQGVVVPVAETHSYGVTPEGRRTATVLLIGVVSIALFAIWTIVTLFDGGLDGAEWITAALMLGLALLSPLVAWNLLEERAAVITTDARGLTFTSLGGIELSYAWNGVRGLRSAADQKSRLVGFLFDDGNPTLAQTPAPGSNGATSDDSNNIVVPAKSDKEEAVAVPTARNGGQKAEAGEQSTDDDEVAPGDEDRETLEIAVTEPGLERIANPLVRALHRQAHGRFIPIYPGAENRAQLLAEIAQRSATPQ